MRALRVAAAILLCMPGGLWAATVGTGLLEEDPAALAKMSKAPRYRAFLPPSVDLSGWFPPSRSQGLQSSCVGWAVGYGLRTYYANHEGMVPAELGEGSGFSPAYIFNQVKMLKEGCGGGSRISDALSLLVNEGVAPMSVFPYSADSCDRSPDASVRQMAQQFRLKSFERVPVDHLDDIKGQLQLGKPVVFGMKVNDRFMKKWHDGSVFDDQVQGDENGGHAMVIAGYDEQKRAFKIFNSWGPEWGDQGYGWVSYRAFAERATNAFTAVPLAAAPAPRPKPAPAVVVIPKPEPVPPPAPVVVVIPKPAPAPAPSVVIAPVPQPPAPVVVKPGPSVVVISPEPDVVEPPAPKPQVVVPEPAPAPAPAPQPTVVVVAPPPPVVPVAPPAPAKPTPAERLESLNKALSSLACSRIQAASADGLKVSLEGFVADDAGLSTIRQLAKQFEFVPKSKAVAVRKWPQCEALITFESWLSDSKNGVKVGFPKAKPGSTPLFKSGDFLEFSVTTPAYPAYVYVTYIPADGSAIQMVQAGKEPLPASSTVVLGADQTKRRFRIAPPLGDEMIIAFSSDEPLFDGPLPDFLEEREFLTRFRQALLSPRAATRSSAAIATLKTGQ